MTRTSFLLFFVGMLSRYHHVALQHQAGVDLYCSEEHLFCTHVATQNNPSSPTPTILPRIHSLCDRNRPICAWEANAKPTKIISVRQYRSVCHFVTYSYQYLFQSSKKKEKIKINSLIQTIFKYKYANISLFFLFLPIFVLIFILILKKTASL